MWEVMWFDSNPGGDPEERETLDAASEYLMGRWDAQLEELDWRLHADLPPSFYRVLAEYEERGAPLGDPFEFLPPEAEHIYWLRRFGLPADLRRHLKALEEMGDVLLLFVPYEECLAYDRQWQRLRVILGRVEYAERQLAQQGLEVAPTTQVLRYTGGTGAPTKYLNAAVRRVYRHLKPYYEAAWPEDRRNGRPTKNPKRLRAHIRELLYPWLGELPVGRVAKAIDNA